MVVVKRRYNGVWRVLGSGGVSAVPLPPTNVQADVSTPEQATVSWTAPTDTGGSPLTGYTVSFTRLSDSLSDTKSVGSGAVSTTILNLAAGEIYTFTVHASNLNGASSESLPVQALITDAGAFVMPIAATVGPRSAPNRTITAAQALTELRSTGYLSRATVTGTFGLAASDGLNWVIEDCRFEGGSTYAIRGYTSGGAFTGTQAQRPVFRYCEILGAAAHSGGTSSSSACVYGHDMIFDHIDVHGGIDGVKVGYRFEIRHSWVHDMDHPSGTHCDAIQITSGTDSILIGNRIDAYIGYSSDGSQVPDGGTANAALQTGAVTDSISALWEHNWFAGGHYTIRGVNGDVRVDYTFRNNRFLRNGTSVALDLTNLPPNRYGATYGGVTTDEIWENNVWDDTDEPIT
ncbi:fibronectin type III domain-containing protein [Candidatus Saccharibacteria bacterium]|nr:MAG: fibronectin type III domain-containing protein [Candidatus Saccharibacteria bacterium]